MISFPERTSVSSPVSSSPEVDTARAELRKIEWVKSLPFLAFHVAALAVFFVPFKWSWVALCLGSYYFRMFALTAFYHRYFSHRTYKFAGPGKLSRVSQFVGAFLGGTCVQKGALWWAAHHRVHHRKSDQEGDVHSPLREGFWRSHVLWILCAEHEATRYEQIPDLAKYPELKLINEQHWIPAAVYGTVIFLLFGWAGFLWGFVLSTVLLWHGTFTINSLSHVFGSRRYSTTDTSRNNPWLALITLGEGWHNNHHAYMASTRQGFFWWELDVSYYALKMLSWVGIVSHIKEPPLHLLEARRMDRGAVDQMPDEKPGNRSSDIRYPIPVSDLG